MIFGWRSPKGAIHINLFGFGEKFQLKVSIEDQNFFNFFCIIIIKLEPSSKKHLICRIRKNNWTTGDLREEVFVLRIYFILHLVNDILKRVIVEFITQFLDVLFMRGTVKEGFEVWFPSLFGFFFWKAWLFQHITGWTSMGSN